MSNPERHQSHISGDSSDLFGQESAINSQRTHLDQLLNQLRELLACIPSQQTRSKGVALMRQLVVAIMSQSPGNSIVVKGRTLKTFSSEQAKQVYLEKMSRSGEWFDDTCMEAWAIFFDLNLRIHCVDKDEQAEFLTRERLAREASSQPTEESANQPVAAMISHFAFNTTADRPVVEMINYAYHHDPERTHMGAHWETGVAFPESEDLATFKVKTLEAPADNNCGAYAVFDALVLQQNQLSIEELAEQYQAATDEVIVLTDCKLIQQRRTKAENLVNDAINCGIGFVKLKAIADEMLEKQKDRGDDDDEYLHVNLYVGKVDDIDKEKRQPSLEKLFQKATTLEQATPIIKELGRVLAVRASIDGYLFKILKAGLSEVDSTRLNASSLFAEPRTGSSDTKSVSDSDANSLNSVGASLVSS